MILIPPVAMRIGAALAGAAETRQDDLVRSASPSRGKALSSVSAIIGTMIGCTSFAAPSAAPVLRIQDIRTLSRDDAAMALPVRISGTCIYRQAGSSSSTTARMASGSVR
jgi:hypothetical protein